MLLSTSLVSDYLVLLCSKCITLCLSFLISVVEARIDLISQW